MRGLFAEFFDFFEKFLSIFADKLPESHMAAADKMPAPSPDYSRKPAASDKKRLENGRRNRLPSGRQLANWQRQRVWLDDWQ